MDVVIETEDGNSMILEIWYFEKIIEIKKGIEKYHNIPVETQILMLDGKVLEDDLDTEHYFILHHTRIKLLAQRPSKDPLSNFAMEDVAEVWIIECSSSSIDLSCFLINYVIWNYGHYKLRISYFFSIIERKIPYSGETKQIPYS